MSLTTATATALTPELIELAEELELLGGGGDARVGYAQVLCRVRPPSARSVRVVTAEPEGCVVHVRDPRCPEETPEADADTMGRLRTLAEVANFLGSAPVAHAPEAAPIAAPAPKPPRGRARTAAASSS